MTKLRTKNGIEIAEMLNKILTTLVHLPLDDDTKIDIVFIKRAVGMTYKTVECGRREKAKPNA